jgi:hypothetical protein
MKTLFTFILALFFASCYIPPSEEQKERWKAAEQSIREFDSIYEAGKRFNERVRKENGLTKPD